MVILGFRRAYFGQNTRSDYKNEFSRGLGPRSDYNKNRQKSACGAKIQRELSRFGWRWWGETSRQYHREAKREVSLTISKNKV